jgi:O-antigen ligase
MGRVRSQKSSPPLPMLSPREWSPQLVALCLFLALLLVTGGSSRYDVPQLVILRPIAVCLVGFGLATMGRQAWRTYRPVLLLFGGIALLTLSHLVPLPPDVWQALPGRQIIAQIDKLAGLGSVWRPLSMFPEGTWNALYSLSVPFAALLFAAQLKQDDQVRLLVWVLILCLVTGLVGVAQGAGSDFDLYGSGQSGTAGVFANRNHQAAMLACTFPMLAALASCAPLITSQPRIIRLIAAAGAVTLIPLILVTGSRMGLVVGLLAFLIAAIVTAGKRSGDLSSPRRVLLQICVAAIVAAGALMATMRAARDVAISRIGDEDGDLRWLIWEAVIDFLPEYMPWGSGVGSFVPVYQIHEPNDTLMPQYVNQAHNDWLDILLTSGVPGAVLAVIAAMMFARAAGSALAARGVAGHLKQTGIGIIFVLAFASLSDYPVRTPLISALFAIAAIWACVPSAQRKTAESSDQNVTA